MKIKTLERGMLRCFEEYRRRDKECLTKCPNQKILLFSLSHKFLWETEWTNGPVRKNENSVEGCKQLIGFSLKIPPSFCRKKLCLLFYSCLIPYYDDIWTCAEKKIILHKLRSSASGILLPLFFNTGVLLGVEDTVPCWPCPIFHLSCMGTHNSLHKSKFLF